MALGLIWLYRKLVSPWMLPCCRFKPTCSEYAQSAIRSHGLFAGGLLSFYRILRCNPFCRAGHDPVPENFHILPGKHDDCCCQIKKVHR
ncbi:MAG TPA: membrane protein insertion efficiency factor YidD [Lentisphaeria bacterium]|nr:membrane protein insertion efficiency factor YidD [Lentisphaeria bacterium]